MPNDRFLPPGTRVIRFDGGGEAAEYGIVVHCWIDNEFPEWPVYDCYVAFFGEQEPVGAPTTKPYLLRYAPTSLTIADENWRPLRP